MRVLVRPARVELIVQKSRFWGFLEPVPDPEAARARLKEAKGTYSDATHVVHAFRTGFAGSETLGCSDDGEPPGTAGRPVLDVLQGAGGGNALLLVVRWFGGTKLGTGGLVKAYGDTAKAVIAAADWEEYASTVRARVTVDWSDLRAIRNELTAVSATVDRESFDQGAILEATIPEVSFAQIQQRTVDLTRGRSRWVLADSN